MIVEKLLLDYSKKEPLQTLYRKIIIMNVDQGELNLLCKFLHQS